MIRIAICDDIKEDREQVLACAERFCRASEQEFSAALFSSADELLSGEGSFDLYLLDVLMPGKDGIHAARELRRRIPDAVIVFITTSLDSAVTGYQVEAAGFLLKPLSQENFDETMSRLLQRGLIGTPPCLSVIYNHLPLEIPLSRIIALESELHRVHVRMDGSVVTVNQRLSDLEEQLSSRPEFLRCHQSFLVNLNYVEEILENAFRLTAGADAGIREVPISRTYYKFCKMAFYQYRLNRFRV